MSTKIMLKRAFCRPIIPSAVTVCFLAVTALAGPFDKACVASDAKWVIHLDVEAFRASKLGRHVVTEHDCRGAVVADDPVGLASYPMDSHQVSRFADE